MLTEDELYLVLPYLRGQSIVNAMCTCRALYSVGLRLLLGSPIRLHEKQIEPFVRFILKDPATYGPMLRDISLINTSRSECFDSAVVALINKEFCDILNYSTNIRAFKVTNVAFSSSLDSVRPLVQKLFTLKTLQKLSLSCNPSRDSSNRALQAAIEASIQNALCSLTHLEITHASGIALASSWRAAFSRFSPTLKSLSIPILLLGDITQPFPRLTTLNVWIMHFPSHRGYIPTTDIVHLFPRLRDLFIEGIVSRIPGEMVACLELDHDFFRAKNTDRSVPQHRWPQLEHVATRADTYYALAVECPVRVLNLTYGGQILRKGRTSEIRQQSLFTVARQVILSAQPHALKVACGLEVEVCNLFAGILSESPQLTHLEYNLCILPTESIRSADKLLNRFISIHDESQCTFLRVNVSQEPSLHVQGSVQLPNLSVENMARRLINTCPNLRHIFIKWIPNTRTAIEANSDVIFLEVVKTANGRVGRRLNIQEYERFNVFSNKQLDS